ncbi:MAG: alpha-glucosidase C-terminal domain-containing protein, partial [Muribaculaceae bacterium]|nr:alpha-glucosidase C-terminal domain-containing protein [Muribaculaceae bacterium]
SRAPEDTIADPYAGRSRMVYLVNHDVFQDQGGSGDIVYHQYLKPLTVLQFTVYGMPLIYNGQETGYKSGGRVSLAEKTPIDWSQPDTTMTSLIKTLTHLKHTQPALRTGRQNGRLTNLTTTEDNSVYAYKRTLDDNDVVVMLNFGDEDKKFSVPSGLPSGNFKNIFTEETVEFSPSATFDLPGLGYAVFVKE